MATIAAMKFRILSCAIVLTLSLGALSVVYADSATWNLNPTSGDWNTATNWTPETVPNGGHAVATFDVSNVTSVSVTGVMDKVDHIAFSPSASAFTITVGPDLNSTLTLSGEGIVNDSGVTQNFVTVPNPIFESAGGIAFTNSATAGDGTVFTNNDGGGVSFFNTSNAGTATIVNQGGTVTFFADDSSAANGTFINEPQFGDTLFVGNSTAGNGTFIAKGGTMSFPSGGSGHVDFQENSTAGTGTFTLERGTVSRANGGSANFAITSSADHSTFTVEGASIDDAQDGTVTFVDTSTAGDAVITLEGGLQSHADGATLTFLVSSNAGNSTLIANSGTNNGSGATINFWTDSTGETSRIELLGPARGGTLDIQNHNLPGVTVGSIEGAGRVFLGAKTLGVGTNNLSTTFPGTISDGDLGQTGGSLNKVGTGTLTLSGANIYTGTTTVSQGILLASNTTGSATGTGLVSINAGTLGGSGIISGGVTIGTGSGAGAFLAPSVGSKKQMTLTLQSSVTLQADSTYTYTFKAKNSRIQTDLVQADGVSINEATIRFKAKIQGKLTDGTVLTLLSNTSASPISGTFANLADGSTITIGNNTFQASYTGGDGNDLTLTVVQ